MSQSIDSNAVPLELQSSGTLVDDRKERQIRYVYKIIVKAYLELPLSKPCQYTVIRVARENNLDWQSVEKRSRPMEGLKHLYEKPFHGNVNMKKLISKPVQRGIHG